ncbi:MAG: sodium:proton antiporter [Hahellaceae bacterium]|nr:sodium:proton antiporter [Hahellaceae bacterium]
MIGMVAMFCQWLAWRTRLPAILYLLLSGLALGPGFGILHPDQLFGEVLFPLISLSVAVILFEGSLTLNFKEVRLIKATVFNLVTYGALITWIIICIVSRWLFDLSWELAILYGALMVVTGPTVIVPMLRTVRPTASVANALKWEGIVIDPIGALLVVMVFEFIVFQRQEEAVGHALWLFCQTVAVGLSTGIASGYALGMLLRRHWVPDFLHNLCTLSLVFLAFTVSNELAHESGLLAVTVMGMWLANSKDVRIQDILNFKENLTILLISGLFILLAARLNVEQIAGLGWAPFLLLAVVQFIARPLSVLASTFRSSFSWQEKVLLAWIGPRGIVAAAVSALFALKLEAEGVAQAELLVPLTFIVIIGTVIIQSATAGSLARRLGVAEPEPRGFLIIGANVVARTIASVLKQYNIPVLLTDSSWDNIRAARMAGLETFFGNPVSEYADQKLDLVGIGKVMALSPQRDLNVIASMRYRAEFGQTKVYTLLTSGDTNASEKHQISAEHRGYTLFDRNLTYSKFASLLSQGATLRKTRLTEEFRFENYMNTKGKDGVPLFAITPKGKLEIFVADGQLAPQVGWTVISLVTERAPVVGTDNIPERGDAAKEQS